MLAHLKTPCICFICPDNRVTGQLASPVSRAKLGLSCDKHGLSINPTAPYLAAGPRAIPHSLPSVSLTSLLRILPPSKDCLEWTNPSLPCKGSWHAPCHKFETIRGACAITTNLNQWACRASWRGRIFATWLMLKKGEVCRVWLHRRHRHMCGHFPGAAGAGCQGGRTRWTAPGVALRRSVEAASNLPASWCGPQ